MSILSELQIVNDDVRTIVLIMTAIFGMISWSITHLIKLNTLLVSIDVRLKRVEEVLDNQMKGL